MRVDVFYDGYITRTMRQAELNLFTLFYMGGYK